MMNAKEWSIFQSDEYKKTIITFLTCIYLCYIHGLQFSIKEYTLKGGDTARCVLIKIFFSLLEWFVAFVCSPYC